MGTNAQGVAVEIPSPTTHSLDVPGARLCYEVQGSGPVLMLIGHPTGSAGFAPIASLLADDYTVVTYDPRGFDRSPIQDRDQDAEPELLADDAWRVLDVLGAGPAQVFGSSGGAVTGLAHEPPLALLLPDAEEARAGMQEIYDTYRREGIGAAWQRFSAFAGINMGPPDENAPPGPADPAAVATSGRFFAHGLFPIAFYQPDFTALDAAPTRVVVAAGSASAGEFAHRTASALAERLGTQMVHFPGGHGGFASNPADFVPVLRRTLT
jgi:alpha/beta hydrolase fold